MRAREAEVYDLGYQRYRGPREGRNRARRALFENGLRTMLGIGRGGRAKILPITLFVAAMAPAVVFAIILTFVGEGVDSFIPGPADYYSVVSAILILFAAIMAPELLAPDRRDNVLPLYLVRPLTPTDYLLARFLAFFVIVLALVYSGQIVLQAGLILTSSDSLEYIRENWDVVWRILLVGAAIAALISIAPMAVSAFTTRRVYAATFVIAAWLILNATSDALTSYEGDCAITSEAENGEVTAASAEGCEYFIGDFAPYVGLLNVSGLTDNINNRVFGVEIVPGQAAPSAIAVSELHDAFPVAAYLLITVGAGALLWSRYRRIRL